MLKTKAYFKAKTQVLPEKIKSGSQFKKIFVEL